jgi:hypothetical protein
MKIKSIILVFAFLFAAFDLIGQNPSNSLIIGSWKLASNVSCDKSADTNAFYSVISFYENHVYQMRKSTKYSDSLRYTKNDTVNIEAGSWKISKNGKILKYKDCHEIPTLNYFYKTKSKEYIRNFTDSCLVTSFDSKDNFANSYYKRISLLSPANDNYRPVIFLVNSLDSTKKKAIIQNNGFNLFSKLTKNSGSVTKTISGYINQICDTSISLIVADEDIVIDQHNGFFSRIDNYYSGTAKKDSVSIQTLKIKDLNFLKYNSRTRSTFHDMGSIISVFSVSALLLAAPLVSINYKNGTFNSNRYFSWAYTSMAGIAISLPISILSKEKKYKLTLRNKVKDKKYWYFMD